jgi:hypothetical protein
VIDQELVTRKIVLILRDLTAVQPIAGKTLPEYLATPVDEVLAERYLERMIGRMIDINYHLLTRAGQPPPTDYYASFLQLAEIGVVDHGDWRPRRGSAIASCTSTTSSIRGRCTRPCGRPRARFPSIWSESTSTSVGPRPEWPIEEGIA